MTRNKLKRIIKRLPYILEMLHDGKKESNIYISREKELIVIDDEVFAVLEIMDEIIEYEKTEWRRNIFTELRKGSKDIKIMMGTPIGRTKFYDEKKKFIDKIYQCCIYKHLVDYDDILRTIVGE